ncbi:hypothetical protein ACROYT_G022190 [Oculina patagonica]
MDSQRHVSDVEHFMHRENVELMEKSVKKARIETTLHHSVSRRMFISWKAIKPLNLLSIEDEQLEELFIGQVQKDDHGQEWKAFLQVNNNMVEFILDIGTQANVIPSNVFNSLKETPLLKTTKAKLTGFSGSEIPVLGVARMFSDVNTESSILDEFNDLFEGLGELEGEHHVEINTEVKPVIHPPRKVSFTLLPKLNHELERMEQLSVIEKVDQSTEWVNSIVIV